MRALADCSAPTRARALPLATSAPAGSSSVTSITASRAALALLSSVTSTGIDQPLAPFTGLACRPSVAMCSASRLTSQVWR
jgi:hypothetical protein